MNIEQLSVKAFMNKAGQDCPEKPNIPSIDARMLRVSLIAEELLELCDAFGLSLEIELGGDVNIRSTGATPNLEMAADATGDLKVVVIGTDVAMGIDGQPVWDEIMRSNFTKFIDGFRREDGKWVKGPSYSPVNLAPILEQQMKGQL